MFFGSIYSNNPEILVDSFKSTSHAYEKKSPRQNNKLLMSIYIKILGIPEMGFQLRSRYFFDTLKHSLKTKPKKILDAGCGIGFYSFMLAKIFPKSEILALDTEDDKLSFCKAYSQKNKINNVIFKKANLLNYSQSKNQYDLIVNIDVLEHISNYSKVLKNFYIMLKEGGVLYIHTPKENQKRFFKNFFKDWEHEEHVREGFDPDKLKKDLEKIGFKSVKIFEGFGLWGKLAWELNHITLTKNFLLAGVVFPFVNFLSSFDSKNTKGGLTLYLTAKK